MFKESTKKELREIYEVEKKGFTERKVEYSLLILSYVCIIFAIVSCIAN